MKVNRREFLLELDLKPYLDGKSVVAWGVCFDDTLAVLAVAPESTNLAFGRTEQTGASFPKTVADKQYGASFLRFGADLIQKTELPAVTATYPYVQMLPDQQILLVSARCSNEEDGPEHNAFVYSGDGDLRQTFCLGDGINQVQVAKNGEIWVAYFDEGVFGNFGWSQPLGQAGLCAFGMDGNLRFSFQPPAGFNFICDCYAMSLSGRDAWLCYYTEFPVVRVDADRMVCGWFNEIAGASALATDGRSVLLFGGYRQDRNRCVWQSLGSDGKMHDASSFVLTIPDGTAVRGQKAQALFGSTGESAPASAMHVVVQGRGQNLHAVCNQKWYRFGLSDM